MEKASFKFTLLCLLLAMAFGMTMFSTMTGAEVRVQALCPDEINCEAVCNGLSSGCVDGTCKCGIDQYKSSVGGRALRPKPPPKVGKVPPKPLPKLPPKGPPYCYRHVDCMCPEWCAIELCIKGFCKCDDCSH